MLTTLDMFTSGPKRGSLISPLVYTATGADTIRVTAWCQLATELGTYGHATTEGLDVERILDSATSDAERSALVRDAVLDIEGVADVVGVPEVTVVDSILSIRVSFITVEGANVALEF